MQIEVSYLCPHCQQLTTVFVEVDSPSDYYAEKICEFCCGELDQPTLDKIIADEVINHFVIRAELLEDR